MKKFKAMLAASVFALLLVGNAKADLILTASTPVNWAFNGNGNFTTADLLFFLSNEPTPPAGFTLFSSSPSGATYDLDGDSLANVYKDDELGSFSTSYTFTTTDDNEFGTLEWVGPSVINREHMFLIVKDGHSTPNVYVYDLTSLGWDGQETILIGDEANNAPLFVAQGSISHIEIAAGGDFLEEEVLPTPEPTSLAIWALGMVAVGFGARRMRKQQ